MIQCIGWVYTVNNMLRGETIRAFGSPFEFTPNRNFLSLLHGFLVAIIERFNKDPRFHAARNWGPITSINESIELNVHSPPLFCPPNNPFWLLLTGMEPRWVIVEKSVQDIFPRYSRHLENF